MNKTLKTLLLASVVILPLSACSGNMHAKHRGMDGTQCKVSKHLSKVQEDIGSVTTGLNAAIAEAKSEKVKKRLQRIVKDAEKISESVKNCKKMCDAKNMASGEDQKDGKVAGKSGHGHKKHHAAKSAPKAPEAAVKPAAGQQPATAK